jgi:dTDP-4-dehydrorhamnose reductase
MKSILIVGASGFIGNALYQKYTKTGSTVTGTYHQHAEEGLHQLDITDLQQVRSILSKHTPDILILPAANPNVEYCEEHPEETQTTNVDGVHHIIDECRQRGIKLVYLSTDYVFDGQNGPYAEDAIPHPVSVYGRQKLANECYIQKQLSNYIIARVTVVYGWEKHGKNFAQRLLTTIEQKKQIRVPSDQIGSPTYVDNLVDMLYELTSIDASGIYNVCGSELMDRYTFALKFAEVFNLDPQYILSVTTSALRQKAPRPLRAGMTVEKIIATTEFSI